MWRRIARITAASILIAAGIAWVLSRVFTDRFAWTQPVWWVPSPVLLAPLWLAGLWTTITIARLYRRAGRHGGASARGAWCRVLVSLAALGSLLTVVIHELGLHRAVPLVSAHDASSATSPDVCRLIFWNQAGQEAGEIAPAFLEHEPTVLVLANRHSSTMTGDLARAFAETGRVYPAVGWPFDVFSRWPVLQWGTTSIGLEGRSRGGDGQTRRDSGWAGWYELETPGGPLVIWAIDLPSDPRAHRMPLAREAGRSIAEWQGAARTRDGDGYSFGRLEQPGFPAPDVIVGDFNIPRGSASLGVFLDAACAGPMRDSFAVAGVGWDRTWPRALPIWAIDHCFVAEGIGVRSWTTDDPGIGGHRSVVVELVLDSGLQRARRASEPDAAAD